MFKRVRVQGPSMQPTLTDGQRLLVWTRAYRRHAPRRGDLVVVQHPQEPFRIVKRVVGVPGDPYRDRRLGPDEFLVRGDNRSATTDSDRWGPVARGAVLGRVAFSYRPLRRVR